MREIKFRAWDKKAKEMIYEALEIKNIGLGEGSVLIDERTQRGSELIWMQYTGLKDRNGKEIWEGDILEYDFLNDRGNGIVEFKGDGWWIRLLASLEAVGQLSYAINYLNPKIIGNIYENSDLKKEAK